MPQHPTEETMNITRKFLGGEVGTPGQPPEGGTNVAPTPVPLPMPGPRLPATAAPVAGQRAYGQQGARRRAAGLPKRLFAGALPSPIRRALPVNPSLSDGYFNLPGPVEYARTPQGQNLMQRILGSYGGRR